MRVLLWVAELADAFWKEAGVLEPFPRGLRRPIARALPLTVVYLPRLRLVKVRQWLVRNRVACPCHEADRPLRACLVARSGIGLVFIDGTDPEEEQRFSLAHELAHFLRDYWQPRRLACRRLGEQVAEVFDGLRPPTPGERLNALLARVRVGFHVHLMRRSGNGRFATHAIAAAERDADRLAYELLAPAESVVARGHDAPGGPTLNTLVQLLQATFGMPAAQAQDYGALLLPCAPRGDPLLRQLGFAP
jgi:hypothetical protein